MVPFMDEISGLAIVKILDGVTHSTMLFKTEIHMKFSHIRHSQ